MMYRDVLKVPTKPDTVIDLTKHVNASIAKSGFQEGLCHVFVKATTAGLLVNENNRMLLVDFKHMLENAAPAEKIYQHPDNAHSHLRASFLHQHISIPVTLGALFLSQSQSLLFFELDVRDREREIVITLTGE